MQWTKQHMDQAKTFIYANARLLDRRRFEFFFEGGSAQSVLTALQAYQNADGGFGSALEPDIRTSESQPVATEMALLIMEEINVFDEPMIEGIAAYLKSITLPGTGGFPRAHISINDAPHAPWWTTEEESTGSLNPTGSIMGLLYKQSAVNSFVGEDWFLRSSEFVWSQIHHADTTDYHDLVQCISFLQHVSDQEQAAPWRQKLNEWLQQPGTIELDPKAEGYVHKVLDWAPTPDSFAYPLISSDDIKRHLDVLISEQQDDGGWTASFPPISPGNEAEWRGMITVNRLVTLKSYGRL